MEGEQQAAPSHCQALDGTSHGSGHSNSTLAAFAALRGRYLSFGPSCPPGASSGLETLPGKDTGVTGTHWGAARDAQGCHGVLFKSALGRKVVKRAGS